MSRKNCDMMRDLLPLYADGVCSEESKKAVTEHLAGCEDCRKELEKMNQKIAVAADTDISAVRKIRKRIRIGKIIVAVIAAFLCIGLLFAGYIWAVTDCTMDYERYNLAENVWMTEDSEGNVWLCTKGNASALSAYVFPTVSDTDGHHMGYNEDFDADKKTGFGATLKQIRITQIEPFDVGSEREQRFWLFNKNKNELTYAFYYDDVTKTEHVLWQRGE